MCANRKDDIYSRPLQEVGDFVFDETVVEVFPDMINRSVPGYALVVAMIGDLASRFWRPGTRCFDLGCSLGAISYAMAEALKDRGADIVAVDNSRDMIQALRSRIRTQPPGAALHLRCEDVCTVEIANASVAVLNLTLQFIEPDSRLALLRRIRRGLCPGGVLILTEKVVFADPAEQERIEGLHTAFKRARGYTELEISQKRTALEQVLIPETVETHKERLRQAGFDQVQVWFQCFNFVSMLAQ